MTDAAFSPERINNGHEFVTGRVALYLGYSINFIRLIDAEESNSFIKEEVDGINFHRYKYIERDSTCTCSLCALKYVIFRGN